VSTKKLVILVIAGSILAISILAHMMLKADTFIDGVGYMAAGSLFTSVAHIVGGENGKTKNTTDAGNKSP
jgi:hypothetical protein